jgi:hypothetical protein
MNPVPESWTRALPTCVGGVARVLFLQHVQGDTFVIQEEEEVSLSDGATLTLMLKQLSGREDP